VNGTGGLAIERLGIRLGGRDILREVTLSLGPQGFIALVGPNGAGKTTLLRGIVGLLRADGELRLGGDPLGSLTLRERARRFAYLPQGQSVHWPLPVRDVVALGRYPHGATDPSRLGAADAEAVERAMQATDVVAFADRPVTELSGGERSRVLLARALAVQAPVILADEPTTSLDPRHQLEVMHLLRRTAAAGTLVIVVTHDLGLAARFADTVVVLKDGRLLAAGPPDRALAPAVLADVFEIDAFRALHEEQPIIVPWTTASETAGARR
jgi:iron complex transport system ATP-binding protein